MLLTFNNKGRLQAEAQNSDEELALLKMVRTSDLPVSNPKPIKTGSRPSYGKFNCEKCGRGPFSRNGLGLHKFKAHGIPSLLAQSNGNYAKLREQFYSEFSSGNSINTIASEHLLSIEAVRAILEDAHNNRPTTTKAA